MKNKIVLLGLAVYFSLTLVTSLPGINHLLVYANSDKKSIAADENVNDTVYNVGSVSKVYVTVAVMQLVDQGKVNLDAPVTDYIKEFRMADERYKDITVRMLMNHTSGIMGTTSKNAFLLDDANVDRGQVLLDSLKNQRLKADPGEYPCYCNDGFDLLLIIVERVSGMDYDTFLDKNITKKLGATSIGTSTSLYGSDDITNIYVDGNRFDKEYVMAIGAGGVYSNAKDTCEFGSAFFKGDKRLLSEKSKNEMNTLSTDAPYSLYGLGWDMVSVPEYDEKGVKVVSKGGDSLAQHTNLLVAPDEEISVCVTTSGGSSSYNFSMSKALMNIALEEKGIEINELDVPDVELKSEVPSEYKKYEGYYTSSAVNGVLEISFPDMKYMLVKENAGTTKEIYYKYSDKGFVRVKGDIEKDDVKVDSDYECLSFVEKDGKNYLVSDAISETDGLLRNIQKSGIAEKIEANIVSDDILNVWRKRADTRCVAFSDKYSSFCYTNPFVDMRMLDDTGYIMVMSSEGVSLLKIVDENNAVSFTSVPSDANRDVYDICVDDKGIVHSSLGSDYVSLEASDKLTKDVKKVSLKTENAKWFSIDDSLANSDISLDRPDNSAVFVYDKYGEMIYSTHMLDLGDTCSLPKGGYVVFLGENGGTIKIK